jgi:hypothetical protein
LSAPDLEESWDYLSALLDYYRNIKDEKLKQKITSCAEWLISSHNSNGSRKINANEWLFDEGNNNQSSFNIAGIAECLFNCGVLLNSQKYIDLSVELTNALFSVFNKKKYLPGEFNRDWKQSAYYIDLQGCARISFLWLKRFEYSGNIQYLNIALKMNDFLISCQCRIKDKNIHGAIPCYFPFWSNKSVSWNVKHFIDSLNLEQSILSSIKQS